MDPKHCDLKYGLLIGSAFSDLYLCAKKIPFKLYLWNKPKTGLKMCLEWNKKLQLKIKLNIWRKWEVCPKQSSRC